MEKLNLISLKDIYNKNDTDFLDLVELIKEIQKDNDKISVEKDLGKATKKYWFNPLLMEYYSAKCAWKEGRLSLEDLRKSVKVLVENEPNYQEAIEYVKFSEAFDEEAKKLESEEEEEEQE